MDSITQITLGAAVGEIVLGRKLGNRAMVWGAIGGTIPDLDIIANFLMEPTRALAAHRGITHSIFFSVFASFLFAWLCHRLYKSGFHRKFGYKSSIWLLNSALIGIIFFSVANLIAKIGGFLPLLIGAGTITLGVYLLYRFYHNYYRDETELPDVPYQDWYWLFFWAFLTHIILDCFTAFGTQIFQPFSNYRVAWNNISVADPAYTVPFLLPLLIAAFYPAKHKTRRYLVYAGIGISSLYMLFTFRNKAKVDDFFQQTIKLENIDVVRCRTSPSILNNVLWSCVAETEDEYLIGMYSLFDSGDRLHHINYIPKNHEYLDGLRPNEKLDILEWFTDEYYTVYDIGTDHFVMSDLRYGAMSDTISGYTDFVFNFHLEKENEEWKMTEDRASRNVDFKEAFQTLWTRMKGK